IGDPEVLGDGPQGFVATAGELHGFGLEGRGIHRAGVRHGNTSHGHRVPNDQVSTEVGQLQFKRLEYPQGLSEITVVIPDSVRAMPSLENVSNGVDLYNWAVSIEIAICDSLDSFGPLRVDSLPGHDQLFSLEILRHESFIIDERPVAKALFLMLDDIQELASDQRDRLVSIVTGGRPSIGVWLAERYEAMTVTELLSEGAIAGRDFDAVKDLERFWRAPGNSRRFERAVLGIADRRARSAIESGVDTFGAHLDDGIESGEHEERIRHALVTVSTRVKQRAEANSEFARWIAPLESRERGSAWDDAVSWRVLEIQIAREVGRAQKRFSFAISEDAPEESGSGLGPTAELFLAREFSLPYYFGPSKFASIASTNIQQFVWLAGDLFEEMIAAALLKRSPNLTPRRQEEIIRKSVSERWRKVPQELRNGREVKGFIDRVGKFSSDETYRPNAPYVPGVTGIAVSMRDRDVLRDPQSRRNNPQFDALARVLTTAMAFNLFEPILNYRVKGKDYMVLYLNRMLCVQFNLPLGYGGFREQSLTRLVSWLQPASPEAGRQGELL
ncbi:MAG: hypothetical protein M3Q03_04050, partial [Chloroflexota bacterium]|nr:hypothetical protein [Chloroflexota bacterium]